MFLLDSGGGVMKKMKEDEKGGAWQRPNLPGRSCQPLWSSQKVLHQQHLSFKALIWVFLLRHFGGRLASPIHCTPFLGRSLNYLDPPQWRGIYVREPKRRPKRTREQEETCTSSVRMIDIGDRIRWCHIQNSGFVSVLLMATYKVFRFNVGMSFVFCFPFFYSENILERYLLIGSPAGYQFRAICIIDGGHEGGFKQGCWNEYGETSCSKSGGPQKFYGRCTKYCYFTTYDHRRAPIQTDHTNLKRDYNTNLYTPKLHPGTVKLKTIREPSNEALISFVTGTTASKCSKSFVTLYAWPGPAARIVESAWTTFATFTLLAKLAKLVEFVKEWVSSFDFPSSIVPVIGKEAWSMLAICR